MRAISNYIHNRNLQKGFSCFLIGISLLVFLFFLNCSQQDSSKKEESKNKNQQLLLNLATNSLTADCIYCTNTQAFQGNCTCYTSLAVGACTGLSSGSAKSNSYKVSCSDLQATGVWLTREDGGSVTCSFNTCPAEAYRAAFSSAGK